MQETTAGDLHDIAFMDPPRSAMNSSPTFVVIDTCVESPQFQARDQISGKAHSATCPSTCASSKVDAGYQFLHSNAAPQRGEDRRRQLWVLVVRKRGSRVLNWPRLRCNEAL